MSRIINVLILLGKKSLFLLIFFHLSVFCFSQSIVGTWEQNRVNGKIWISFSNDNTWKAGFIYDNGERENMPFVREYFARNNVLRFLDGGGTGKYAERARFEYEINRNILILIALNPSARVTNLEGRWTRSR